MHVTSIYVLDTCLLRVCHAVVRKYKILFFFFDVSKQIAVSHKGQDNVGGRASIQTHSNQTEDVRVVKIRHFHTLSHQL